MIKRTLQIFFVVALVAQVTGCVYYAGDRRYHPYWYHHSDDAVVVHVHD
jgi:hypothetical protein